ncbi:helicase-exonuclease AddAB subunit AddB [Alteribacillus bidgolensis]|uniref:ATP-dependent helicase/deoxyribonuclease subunit B n=1 Tax=Alteribacillus bidgolensis TaxID=930129 RepID=A0A1G8CEV7_9BACI|nr:helicase-exonuclease AddAB subunit AddB [Alteribacillus bidgolensis]SDH43869.1 DNA helicase/exodeoxyribonuclease V, subunit B [Alteribacillus bidgolensis]
MGAVFYIGRTGTGKTQAIQAEMKDKLKKQPKDGPPIIYLVPDQMTFQAEYDLLKRTKTGMTRCQVLSFSRMAWRVLQETGGITKTYLQQTGIQMVLRKVIEEQKDGLRLYRKASDKSGFIEHLEQLITEFKRQVVSVDMLEQKYLDLEAETDKSAPNQVLTDKLHDIVNIWKNVELVLGNRYAGTEDYLRLLAEKAENSSLLEEAEIYVDGFHSFTPQELNVLQALMNKSEHITFALTLDKPYDMEPPHMLDLFQQTGTTYQKLRALCDQTDCNIEETVVFKEQKKYKTLNLRHLEKYFEKRPTIPSKSDNSIMIRAAVNRRAEIEACAREIIKLVQEKGYRYKDIAVITRNMEDYGEMLSASFQDYNIPLFNDQRRPMLNHPVIECIRSSLETISENWRYEPLFRSLKTDMFFSIEEDWEQEREKVDMLENYVLAYGIKEKHWKQKGPWGYVSKRTSAGTEDLRRKKDVKYERTINLLRDKFSSALLHFEKRIKKRSTLREFSVRLFEFLEELYVPNKIEKLRDKAKDAGDLAKAREHEQVWGAVIELLEQIVEMAGDEEVTFSDFQKIIEAGLESMSFSIVPPAIDQVTAADMERSRLTNIKIVFLLGVNEGIIPAAFEEEGILNDDERQWFEKQGMELADDSGQQLLNEQFLIYRALSLPEENLYVSYPLADEEGKTLQPSIIINQLKDIFPDLEESLLFNEPNEFTQSQQIDFVGPHRKTLSFLTYQLQLWKKGYPISSIWWDVYNWYIKNDPFGLTPSVLNSLYYMNQPVRLSTDTSKYLYGEKLKASVSRMEKFESCAFSQFASYGLSLKERDIYKLEAPDIGQLFHAALKDMTEVIKNEGKDWGELSPKECRQIAKECVAVLVPKIQREILLSTNRYKYLQKKLEDTVGRASEMLSKQAKVSGFSPYGLELGFGPEQELPPLRFTLADGTEMEVAGRIDRVDTADGTEGIFVRIIDYKSSEKDIKLADVYFGLALQMLVYLDVILSFSEDWIGDKVQPAGVLYFHVHNPFIQAKQGLSEEELENEFLKRFKMKGLLLAEEESVRLMDQALSTGHSQIVPAAIKKDGSFYSNSSVLPSSNYESLRQYIRKKLQDIGYYIMQGNTEIKPFKNQQNTACSFCSFKAVCQFDTSFEANDYRVLSKNKKEIHSYLFDNEQKKGHE